MKYYKFLFSVFIDLGDFHSFMAFFGVIGKFISGSGFEEIVYQSDLCTSGSLNAVLSGKHYNRCWWVHENFSEALERLFIKKFLPEHSDIIQKPGLVEYPVDIEQLLNDTDVISCITKYEEAKRRGLNGEFGSTMQFWLKYVEMVETLQQFHFALNTNNLSLKLQSWEKFLPLCFTTNKVHYARYRTYHIQQLKQFDKSHPGALGEIESFVSVRRNNYGIEQAVDLAGEQTYMQNAKTTGMLVY